MLHYQTPVLSSETDVTEAIKEITFTENLGFRSRPRATDWEAVCRELPRLAQYRESLYEAIAAFDREHNSNRVGLWFPMTASGRRFWPLDPRPQDFCIEDIVHSLSNIVRFNGHAQRQLTVAQHSVFVSEQVPGDCAFLGLLHDAPEAYTGDMISPLKAVLGSAFTDMEDRIWRAIAKRFDIDEQVEAWRAVKEADRRAVATESRDQYIFGGVLFDTPVRPYAATISEVWSHGEARERFLRRFEELSPAEGVQSLRHSPGPA